MSKRKSEDSSALGTDVKTRRMEPFRSMGEFQDEVTLLFDDEKQLFVPATFLKMVSPVFQAMLESEFKEKSTGVIKFSHKTYDDFLEFLEVLHPAVDKRVTETNVDAVLPLAHEYLVTPVLTVCKTILTSIQSNLLRKRADDLKKHKSIPICYGMESETETCLKLLISAYKGSFTELTTSTIALLAGYRSHLYRSNKLVFSLPDKTKADLLLARIEKIE